MASLPPSMLNMGWEYPAHLLQGPDPLPAPRGTAARGGVNQQPNNVVSLCAYLQLQSHHMLAQLWQLAQSWFMALMKGMPVL